MATTLLTVVIWCTLLIVACMCSEDKNYLDCPGNKPIWGFFRVCCESSQLPNGCECFDIWYSDFTNSAYHKPFCPKWLHVHFYLFDRGHSEDLQNIRSGKASITKSSFSKDRQTLIIVHGFTDNGKAPWMMKMKNELLQADDFNVILVDWQIAAKGPNYFQAVANTRVVGAMIARLILDLHTYAGADFQKFHLVGHSLGSHIVGYAGKEIKRLTNEKLGRITGLDPAGPAFEGYPRTIRLDAKDANFVEVIHTDSEPLLSSGFGIRESIGDVDYYANGGKHQPGCPQETGGLLSMLRFEDDINVGACSHSFCLYIFIDSIRKCAHEPCAMGIYTDTACRGNFYPNTTHKEPLCSIRD